MEVIRAREVRIKLPHIEATVDSDQEEKPVVAGQAVHVDGELFPLSQPTLRFRSVEKVQEVQRTPFGGAGAGRGGG